MSSAIEDSAAGLDPERISIAASWEIESPAFPVSYPLVVNAELIGDHARSEMEVSWARGTVPAQPVKIFHLRDVYVVGEGLVFDRHLRLLANVIPRMTPQVVRAGFAALLRGLDSGTIGHEDRFSILAKRRAPDNYGHYLLEMLPLAMIGRAVYGAMQPRYAVPRVSPGMQDVVLRSLRLAGISLDRLILLGAAEPMHFDEVVVIAGLSDHGIYMSPLSVKAVASLGAAIPQGPHKKLFVTRQDNGAGQRALLNQADVQDRLVAKGFVVVEPGRLSFEDQICIFSGAECIVGVCGSAMANIVFCRPGSSVVSLVPAQFPDTFCWFNAAHASLHYMEIRGDQRVYDQPTAWTSGFTIRQPDIEFLENLDQNTVGHAVRLANVSSDVTVVHVQDTGDLRGVSGAWAGRPGSRRWIEGVVVYPPDEITAEQVLYRVLQPDGRESAWVAATTFAGTRGQMKPILGFQLRMHEAATLSYRFVYEATFIDGSSSGLCSDGEMVVSPGFVPLEALRVEFRRRAELMD